MDGVCVVIVSYNGMRWIDKCIQSLLISVYPVDILIVDNGSNDGTVEFVNFKYPDVVLIPNQENLGFGGANNLGIIHAIEKGYDYFFLLNQDAWVEDTTIGELIFQMKENPEYGILSPLHLNGSSMDFDPAFAYYMEKYNQQKLLKLDDGNKFHFIVEVPFVNAAAWLISKSACLAVGKFHPLFFHYGEDNNYVHRLFYSGYKLGVVAGSYISHDREERGYNELKDHPENAFKKEMLKELLHPNRKTRGALFWTMIKEINAQLRFVQLKDKLNFICWSFKTYRFLNKEVDRFDVNSLKLEDR